MENKPKIAKLVLKNKPALIGNTLVEIKKSAEPNSIVKKEVIVIDPIIPSQTTHTTKANKGLKTTNVLKTEKLNTEARKIETSTEQKESTNIQETKAVAAPPAKKPYLSHAEYFEILDRLIQKYPNVFSKNNPKILAIGIDKEIKADKELGFANKKINYFLGRYCGTRQYRTLHIEGAERYNLQGEIDGQVSEAQASRIKKLHDEDELFYQMRHLI